MRFDKLEGDKWSEQTARVGFPILVEYVRNGRRSITYGEWDEEIVTRKLGGHVFLTQYGRPAGRIGNACAQYAENMGIIVPPINLMIVNKRDGLPGDGAASYIENYCKKKLGKKINASRLTKEQMRAIIDEAQDDILAFPDWEKVLRAYNLSPSLVSVELDAKPKSKRRHPDQAGWHRGPESEAHKHLKQRIIDNPRLVGLTKDAKGRSECRLWSGDRLDVYFTEMDLAVEVKTADASWDELHRGIFQCIKYKAILRAQKIYDRKVPLGDSVLAVGGRLPKDLRDTANLFNVAVFEDLTED